MGWDDYGRVIYGVGCLWGGTSMGWEVRGEGCLRGGTSMEVGV